MLGLLLFIIGGIADSIFTVNPVVVTATRTPKALKDVPVVTRVIGLDDIRRTDATNIQDLLTTELPGLEFGYAMSREPALNMGGFGGNAILFLVDGERLAGETMDNVDYSRLNLDNVGRVEIVKGAASALYGANAVGGVVNLISREDTAPWTLNVNSRYSSAGDGWRNGVRFSFKSGRWRSQTAFQQSRVSTIRLADAFDTQSDLQTVWGGSVVNVKERLIYNPIENLKLIARGSFFKRHSNRTTYTDHYDDYSTGLRGVYDFGIGRNLEISYSFDRYDKSRYVLGQLTNSHDYSNRQHVVHSLFNLPVGKWQLTFGTDYLNDYLSTYQFTDNQGKSQYSADAYAQFDINPFSWLNIVGSLRHDYFSASKSNATTARLAAMLKWSGFSVRSSYAGGFRAPTLKELYMDFDMVGMMMIYGNPDLKAERSNNYNLAFEHYGNIRGCFDGSYSITLMGYCNKYDKRITTTDVPVDSEHEMGLLYCNEDGVTVSGVEFNGKIRTQLGLSAAVSYNYLYASGNSMQSQFSQPRRHSMTCHIDYDKQIFKNYSISASVSCRYMSKSRDAAAPDKAYSIWKATLNQRLVKAYSLTFVIDNLFNYKPKVFYLNTPTTIGTNFSVGLSVDIDSLSF